MYARFVIHTVAGAAAELYRIPFSVNLFIFSLLYESALLSSGNYKADGLPVMTDRLLYIGRYVKILYSE